MSRILNRIKATDPRVEDVEDAGPDEPSRYWIYLRSGYRSVIDDCHIIAAETVRDARAALSAVEPCNCRDCQRDAKRAASRSQAE